MKSKAEQGIATVARLRAAPGWWRNVACLQSKFNFALIVHACRPARALPPMRTGPTRRGTRLGWFCVRVAPVVRVESGLVCEEVWVTGVQRTARWTPPQGLLQLTP
jgi:hypothetical protein